MLTPSGSDPHVRNLLPKNPWSKDRWREIDGKPLALLVAGAVGGAVASWLMGYLSDTAMMPLAIVPFATSILVVMGTPEAEPAQPRALIGGHLISTLCGLVVVHLAGPSPLAAAAAVGIAMLAMHLTRSFHPPAGIDPLIIVHQDMGWSFLLMPVATGALLLAAFAFVWHSATRRGSWPLRWW
jgi:CBS-domain-containing membrane protein